MYLSLTLDRKAGCPTFIFSPDGGMAIEDVAESNPEKIFKLNDKYEILIIYCYFGKHVAKYLQITKLLTD